MAESKNLQGSAALVTGASSGIGRAIARALDEAGASVSLCARRAERLRETADELRHSQVVAADLTDESRVVEAVNSAADHWGRLDILVNCAGVARQAKLATGDTRDWRDMLNVNVLGLAMASREALKFFDPEKGGHILNLGSMSGHRVPGRGGFYAASKFAVRAMTEGLRQELRAEGNPTRVSEISPGFVDTELLDEYFQSAGKDRYESIDYPILNPEDIARTAIYILTAPDHVDVTDVLLRPAKQST